jgi:hypothetical protein
MKSPESSHLLFPGINKLPFGFNDILNNSSNIAFRAFDTSLFNSILQSFFEEHEPSFLQNLFALPTPFKVLFAF